MSQSANFNFSSSLSSSLNLNDDKLDLTKTEIVTRLFNQGYINFNEATILLKEFVVIEKPKEEKFITINPSLIPFKFESTCSYSDNKEDMNTLNPIE